MAEKIIVNVPDGVHIQVSRFSPKAISLKELVASHILLPIRAWYGREVRFEWKQPADWIRFCNGEEVQVSIIRTANAEKIAAANIRHGEDRVVYVKPALEEAENDC